MTVPDQPPEVEDLTSDLTTPRSPQPGLRAKPLQAPTPTAPTPEDHEGEPALVVNQLT